MALHSIYETDWGQTIDETVRQDETSRRLAETGEEAVIAERATIPAVAERATRRSHSRTSACACPSRLGGMQMVTLTRSWARACRVDRI